MENLKASAWARGEWLQCVAIRSFSRIIYQCVCLCVSKTLRYRQSIPKRFAKYRR